MHKYVFKSHGLQLRLWQLLVNTTCGAATEQAGQHQQKMSLASLIAFLLHSVFSCKKTTACVLLLFPCLQSTCPIQIQKLSPVSQSRMFAFFFKAFYLQSKQDRAVTRRLHNRAQNKLNPAWCSFAGINDGELMYVSVKGSQEETNAPFCKMHAQNRRTARFLSLFYLLFQNSVSFHLL